MTNNPSMIPPELDLQNQWFYCVYRSMGDPKKLYQPEHLIQDGWGRPHRWVDRGPPSFSFHSRYNTTPPRNRGSQKIMADFYTKDQRVKGGATETSSEGAIPSQVSFYEEIQSQGLTNSSSFGEDDSCYTWRTVLYDRDPACSHSSVSPFFTHPHLSTSHQIFFCKDNE